MIQQLIITLYHKQKICLSLPNESFLIKQIHKNLVNFFLLSRTFFPLFTRFCSLYPTRKKPARINGSINWISPSLSARSASLGKIKIIKAKKKGKGRLNRHKSEALQEGNNRHSLLRSPRSGPVDEEHDIPFLPRCRS